MRAAVFPSPGACDIVERETPLPAERQALVRVQASGLCGTDLHIYRGQFPAKFPLIAGHEFAGIVEDIGSGVTHLRTGDHITIDPNLHCGTCRPCRRGLTHLCRNLSAIGVTLAGGFSTHCLVPARQAYKVPKDMPFDVAAMAEPLACCLHGIERARIRPGDVVALIGAGMMGLLLLQLALLRGASVVIVSELSPEKRARALKLGASQVVDPQTQDLTKVVKDATENLGADVVIECVGSEATAQQVVELVGDGGTVLFFGVAPPEAQITVNPYDIYRREITITGSFTNPFTHAPALALLASGRLQVADLISHHLPLEELLTGLELLESGQATKIMIEPR